MFQTVILSDSLLRPILQGLTSVPDDWFINCTPGGTFSDLAAEIGGVGLPPSAERIFVVCGTNYGESANITKISTEMRKLYCRIREKSSSGTLVGNISLFM